MVVCAEYSGRVGGKEVQRRSKQEQIRGGSEGGSEVCRERGIKDPAVQCLGGGNHTRLYFEVEVKCFRKKRYV